MNNYIYQKMTFKEINKVLDDCFICVLSICHNNIPYMIPMYFEYYCEENEPKLVLESKNIGQKMNWLKNNAQVCLFIQYNDVDSYKTIIINGKAKIKEMDASCSYHNMVKIIVQVQDITGRIYKK